ncbi:uncharacterized protein E5676_scaffold68479G00160 [Cucumis melo var. makuwa]|uniref:Uncharacterized protein n=1 Tax=Cucumis melo var. makuwa TaxID=1194695 RepID=A0A5D3DCP0_CUCMM|nr:uncharacterized protein E5676_scaffold68479G00160 [Cucumis melo var. makuwa]
MAERDFRRTTQNSGVMVIDESSASGSGDNNLYGGLYEVLHVQYPMERSVWLFKCRRYNTDNTKSQRAHVGLGYKVINTSHFWFTEELNKRIWDVSVVDDFENEQLNVLEIVVGHQVDEHIKDDTLYMPKVDTTVIEGSVVHHVADDFIDDGDEQLSHQSGSSDDK